MDVQLQACGKTGLRLGQVKERKVDLEVEKETWVKMCNDDDEPYHDLIIQYHKLLELHKSLVHLAG